MKLIFQDVPTNSIAPLFCQYEGQCSPQRAHLNLDSEGSVTVDYDAEIGNGVSAAVWHNRVLRYSIPADLSTCGISRLFADTTINALLSRVLDGFTIEFDGDDDRAKIWDVSDWFGDFHPSESSEMIAGLSINDAVKKLIKIASYDNVLLTGDIERFIVERAE